MDLSELEISLLYTEFQASQDYIVRVRLSVSLKIYCILHIWVSCLPGTTDPLELEL